MNEIEFAKFLRKNYDEEMKRDDDFINLIGDISEYEGLDYDKIKEKCAKLGLNFMTSQEALKLCKTKQARESYLNETNKFIFFDSKDEDKGID